MRAVEQRFLAWPSGPTQDEIKELEHEADQIVSELLSLTNSLFVTPYDRDDLITLAFAIDDVADAAENAAELLGLYGVEMPTKQSIELCGLLVRAAERAGGAARATSRTCTARRTDRDQGDRGRGRRGRPRRAGEPVQGRPHRPGDRDSLEGHLRGARGCDRRVRDGGAPRREHPREERLAPDESARTTVATPSTTPADGQRGRSCASASGAKPPRSSAALDGLVPGA